MNKSPVDQSQGSLVTPDVLAMAAEAASVPVQQAATTMAPAVSLMDLKEGDIDPETGYKIAHLVAAYETCIIYFDAGQALHYRTTPDHDWPDAKAFASIEVEGDYLRTAAGAQLKGTDLRQVNYLVGEAIAFALASDDFASAKNALARARELLVQHQRVRIVIMTLVLTAVGVLSAIIVRLPSVDIPSFLGYDFAEGLLCAAVGGVGAAISLMQRSAQLPLPITAKPWVDLLECLARFTVGLVAGATLYIAISANLLLGVVNKMDTGSAGTRLSLLLGLALAAGASERAFPKLVRSFEKAMH
jgi:hypothetical protein